MHPPARLAVVILLLLALSATACLGPNYAAGHLAKWNRSFENQWAEEGLFILLFPAYMVLGLGDILIFNTIQWWSGVNPIAPPWTTTPSADAPEFG